MYAISTPSDFDFRSLSFLQIGKLLEYDLGKWVRQRYADLLMGKPYRYDRILVNSSDVDRTLMSAELFLAGMFPPDVEEMWTNEIRWQPIPVHTLPKTADNVNIFRACSLLRVPTFMKSSSRVPCFENIM